ncbi:GNAT family N-acetyltransferase [Shinella sp.]|uniref:GNAT family N-acetyltransferase n=1 Tax=Shinella sp. TaxID=1870904 RepID=UPI002582917D|nr:GNAT family N-acetyltransferase [Shinella sp.]
MMKYRHVELGGNIAGMLAVRQARESDLTAIQAIYAHHVTHGTASFETTPPTTLELAERRQASLRLGMPYLVAEAGDGSLAGYCYASSYRPRPAYRYTIENSVYVRSCHLGRGVGTVLLNALISECEAKGQWRQMVAVIGDSDNLASISLHRKLGFQPVGTIRSAGFKFGRWVDSVLMQRALNGGDANVPEETTDP